MTQQTISFVAGKSGGHIIPCLTLAQKHLKKQPETHVLFFSNNTPLDKKILSENPVVTQHIPLPLIKFKITQVYRYPLVILQAMYSFLVSLYYLWKNRPTKLISTGGIVSIPVCLSAFLLRIPIELYEPNAVPGKTIKLLAPLAQTIFVCFAQTKKYFSQQSKSSQHCVLVNYPARYTAQDKQISQSAAQSILNLNQNKKTILVLGGSQGSISLNNIVKQWLNQCPVLHKDIQIIHQTGDYDSTNWPTWYQQRNITAQVFNYKNDLACCYIAADLVLCRAGAGLLFEVQFFGTSCIVVPLKANTTTHQIDNAQAIAQKFPEQFQVFLQDKIIENPDPLFSTLNQLLMNTSVVQKSKNQVNPIL